MERKRLLLKTAKLTHDVGIGSLKKINEGTAFDLPVY